MELRESGIASFYDDAGSIGRRYARMDEIGTPFCITVDYTTLEDDTVRRCAGGIQQSKRGLGEQSWRNG